MYMLTQFYNFVTSMIPYPPIRAFVTLIMVSFAILVIVSIVYSVIHVARILKDLFILMLG